MTTAAQTGVEMEALVAVTAAALTVYDMCKALDKGMEIGDICLLEKTGGKSGDFFRYGARDVGARHVYPVYPELRGKPRRAVPASSMSSRKGAGTARCARRRIPRQ